jgi:hypothetical protein
VTDAPPTAPEPEAPAPAGPFQRDGAPLATAADVAAFFNVSTSSLIWALYQAPEETRYRAFEIPKRTGGMRQIHAPKGLVRDLQQKIRPLLDAVYEPHPAAHGFIPARSICTNAALHAGQRLVLNIDLADFFPSINFGRVRGLFMARPFGLGPAAATVLAQICTHRNTLPQGAPTSPTLSNLIAAALDRRLSRLARENRLRYSRYADDITFSTNQPVFPPAVLIHAAEGAEQKLTARPGEALERATAACGFAINPRKVRLQARHQRQSVTGLSVNTRVNITRARMRRLRAMLHAWEKFGLAAAARDHFERYAGRPSRAGPPDPARAFRHVVYGHLAFLGMVRGREDGLFLKLCAEVLKLDPNPSRFIRQMAFGGADFEVFISHASEDKESVALPIFAACEKLGVRAFLDLAHIGWGESFAARINDALGSARTVLAIVSPASIAKVWPMEEVNKALTFEVQGQKKVLPLIVGEPDLSRLPLIATKDYMIWKGDAEEVARRVRASLTSEARPKMPPPPSRRPALPEIEPSPARGPADAKLAVQPKRGLFAWLFAAKRR